MQTVTAAVLPSQNSIKIFLIEHNRFQQKIIKQFFYVCFNYFYIALGLSFVHYIKFTTFSNIHMIF